MNKHIGLGFKNRPEEQDGLNMQIVKWAGLKQEPSNSSGVHHKTTDLIGLSTFSHLFIFAAGKKKASFDILFLFSSPSPPSSFRLCHNYEINEQ